MVVQIHLQEIRVNAVKFKQNCINKISYEVRQIFSQTSITFGVGFLLCEYCLSNKWYEYRVQPLLTRSISVQHYHYRIPV